MPLPPLHEEVSNWQLLPHRNVPPEYPNSVHELIPPRFEPSHCSPASITALPQYPPLAGRHCEVSREHEPEQRSVPLAKPRPVQLSPARLLPSHDSPASITPSPQRLPLPPVHAEVSKRQFTPHDSAPDVNASKSGQPFTVPQL